MAKSPVDKLLTKHNKLTHSVAVKVISHVQREDGDWWLNTLMIENIDVPFKYRRKQPYQSLNGAKVNLTYYSASEEVAGLVFEYMKVVRIKRS